MKITKILILFLISYLSFCQTNVNIVGYGEILLGESKKTLISKIGNEFSQKKINGHKYLYYSIRYLFNLIFYFTNFIISMIQYNKLYIGISIIIVLFVLYYFCVDRNVKPDVPPKPSDVICEGDICKRVKPNMESDNDSNNDISLNEVEQYSLNTNEDVEINDSYSDGSYLIDQD